MTRSYFVEGVPVPKQSFRASRHGGYIDPRVKAWEEAVGWESRRWYPEPLTCEVNVDLTFYLADNRRKDLDNLSKGTMDGMKGIVFADDCQVVKLTLSKVLRKERPGVYVSVEEVV